jgi:hypothetical protein
MIVLSRNIQFLTKIAAKIKPYEKVTVSIVFLPPDLFKCLGSCWYSWMGYRNTSLHYFTRTSACHSTDFYPCFIQKESKTGRQSRP